MTSPLITLQLIETNGMWWSKLSLTPFDPILPTVSKMWTSICPPREQCDVLFLIAARKISAELTHRQTLLIAITK
jgi:hypothetical protein